MNPLKTGQWPDEMRTAVGDRLPPFSAEESAELKGAMDFIGLNHYTTSTVTALPPGMHLPYPPGYAFDQAVLPLPSKMWAHNVSASGWPIEPEGMRATLQWVSATYGSPPIVVTESGVALDDTELSSPTNDAPRIQYLMGYAGAAADAIASAHVDLRGYFVWSLSDNLEWSSGYSVKFGLVHVSRKRGADGRLHPTNFQPKASYSWWKKAAACNCVPGW